MRKVLLVVTVVVGAAGAAATPASAEVVQELADGGGSADCETVTMVHHRPASGNCTLYIVGSYDFFAHGGLQEYLFNECDEEFEAAFNADGSGYIYNQVRAIEGVTCGHEPCDEPEVSEVPHRNFAWTAQIGAPQAGPETLTFTVCFNSYNEEPGAEGRVGAACTLTVGISSVGHDHELSTAGQRPCQNFPPYEFDGHWVTERTPAHPHGIELLH